MFLQFGQSTSRFFNFMEETRREGYLLEVSLCRKKSYQEFTMPKAIAVALSSPTPEL
jgi:hypothetical protein